MKTAVKKFTSAARHFKSACCLGLAVMLVATPPPARATPFSAGPAGYDREQAVQVMARYRDSFEVYAELCRVSSRLMRSVVFPEVLRYSSLRDGIETESLRTLYVQLGSDYADFSIGLFQMKPSFAVQVEAEAVRILPLSLQQRLMLAYPPGDPESERRTRVRRLQDPVWQLRYLAAFVAICNYQCRLYAFKDEEERMQFYALKYNGGLQAPDRWIRGRMAADNRYLASGMPGGRFRYAALASWYFRTVPA